MPKLWTETIETHRREVRDALLDTTAALVAESGLRSVTMSQIAQKTGIGRATLYKYFPDVESILIAWHDREIAAHLEQLAEARDRAEGLGRLEAVLQTYASILHGTHRHHDAEVAAFLHRDERLVSAHHKLHALIRDLVAEGVKAGDLRDDVPVDELTTYCINALASARTLRSHAAVRRLVAVTLSGLSSSQ